METKIMQYFIEKIDSLSTTREDLLEEFMSQTLLTEEEKKFLRLFSEAQVESGELTINNIGV